jgi:transcriptional regulator with XRE-family HTH domain
MGIGMRLQQLRKAAGLSQTELAQLSETSIDSLRNWEQDRSTPKLDAAARLAKALGVTLDALVSESPESRRESRRLKKTPKGKGK